MTNRQENLDVANVLQVAALRPIHDGNHIQLVPTTRLPDWWSNDVGTVSDSQVQLTSPVLQEFLDAARSLWQGELVDESASGQSSDEQMITSMLFEVDSAEGDPIQLQALAGRKDGDEYFIVRNLCAIDDMVTSVLRAARVNLIQQSKERTHHRQEVATISADRDEAKRMEAAKSSFLANMSHEIRTPLTTILGMVSMAQKSTQDQEQQQGCLDAVANAANRLLRLSNDILDLSRIQAEKLELDVVAFSLHDLMQEFEHIWRLHGAQKNLTFETQLDPTTPNHVEGDPFRLQQVLTNLVGNAVKFTETGGVKLMIAPLEGDNRRIRFVVQDTGVGISQQQIERIFDTFTQVDESPTRRHQGAGLGLAIASSLVRLMGSEIEVESESGKGSCFSFHALLPEVTSDDVGEAPSNTAAKSSESIRVLVAEDHALNRSIIVEALQSEGIETVEAENGKAAIDAWRQDSFDVVLMDCQMPIMSGLEAISQIREEEGGNRTPIIALTAHAMKEEKQRLFNSGADRYMPKPFDREELIELVYEMANA